MADAFVTVQFIPALKEKLENMAKTERRTLTEQAAYLMENGLLVLEQQQAQTEMRRDVSNG
jgi:hypothetical protein